MFGNPHRFSSVFRRKGPQSRSSVVGWVQLYINKCILLHYYFEVKKTWITPSIEASILEASILEASILEASI